ncbi:hypothetical protein ACFWVM_08265 [Nocardia fluminea]|uniref:hypothetical protein n=1 Tax=Nocardia fluminea TaxID=134984 RepID=UPI003646055E
MYFRDASKWPVGSMPTSRCRIRVRSGLTGSVNYTMDARDAARAIRVPHPRLAVPVNYDC